MTGIDVTSWLKFISLIFYECYYVLVLTSLSLLTLEALRSYKCSYFLSVSWLNLGIFIG